MSEEENCLGLARIPLLLNLIILAYSEISLSEWQRLDSLEERRSYLFDAYINKMLKRRYKDGKPKPFNNKDTRLWLGWLAKKLIEQNQTEFFIENLQPSWLESRGQKSIFWMLEKIIHGVFTGIFYAVIYGKIDAVLVGFLNGIIVGMVVDSVDVLSDKKIKTLPPLNLTIQTVKKMFLIGLFAGLFWVMIYAMSYGLKAVLEVGLAFGLVCCFSSGLILTILKIETKTFPNQEIWRSPKNGFIFFILTYPSIVIILFLLSPKGNFQLIESLLRGMFLPFFFGFLLGGLPVIEHFSLRLMLWYNKLIPWNYAKFLDYGSDRLFLQRVGGSYRFIHDFLRQHFAFNRRLGRTK